MKSDEQMRVERMRELERRAAELNRAVMFGMLLRELVR